MSDDAYEAREAAKAQAEADLAADVAKAVAEAKERERPLDLSGLKHLYELSQQPLPANPEARRDAWAAWFKKKQEMGA
jgi:hypothetical protein